MSSDQLMAICDQFWAPGQGDYAEFVPVYNELATRGPEIRDWCRRLLVHSDYCARESGAFLLGQLGRRRQLGDAVEAVVAELGALIRRPFEEDGKEFQAVSAAIESLAGIGHLAAVAHLRSVLQSDDESLDGDCQWDAAEALGRLVEQPFREAPDRVRAAQDWLAAHPMAGA
jgi:HEAT repeat protein